MHQQPRRTFVRQLFTSCAAMSVVPSSWAMSMPDPSHSFNIAVCDWMILKRQKLGAFELTKKIGADGLELDMGGLGDRPTFNSQLDDPDIRKSFLAEAKKTNITICSLAMSGFYAQSFATRPTYQKMVEDCITTMTQMHIKVAFLPLGVQGDLVQHPELRPAIVERLKTVGKMAEGAGVTIGIETALDATREAKLLDEIGRTSIRSYFNFANALQQHRNVSSELKILGKDRICQIHCTDEDGVWLQNNQRIHMEEIYQTLKEMDWKGWLVIERSRDASNPHDVVGNFGANTTYLKEVFQST